MRRFSSCLAVLLLAFARVSAAGPDQSPADLFQQVSDSIVVVQADTPSGPRQGSGVVIGASLVVTNQHVVDGATSATVAIQGRNVPARVRSTHVGHDLALLEAETGAVKPAVLRGSTTLRVGERAYAIGAPLGLEKTLSEGVVSGLRPQESVFLVQTSAAISPGSSGGGLFDAKGQLIGITTRYKTDGQNLNFAMPTEWIVALRQAPPTRIEARPRPPPPRRQTLQWAGISETLATLLKGLAAKGEEIRSVAFTPQDGWVVLYGDQFQAVGPSSTFITALTAAQTGARVHSAAFSENAWLFLIGKNGFRGEGTSKEFMESLIVAAAADETLTSAALAQDGELVIRGGNGWWQRGVPEGLFNTLTRLRESNQTIDFVTMRSDRVWVMVHDGGRKWTYGNDVPPALLEAMQRAWERGSSITSIALAPSGGWVLMLK